MNNFQFCLAISQAITICRKNILTSEYSLGFLKNLSEKFELDYSYFTDYDDTVNDLSSKKQFSDLRRYIKYEPAYLILRNVTSIEEMKALSNTMEEILVNCSFNGINCNHTDWIYMFNRVS